MIPSVILNAFLFAINLICTMIGLKKFGFAPLFRTF